MPELPDLQVFSRNLTKKFKGKKLTTVKVANSKNLKDSQSAITKHLKGKTLHNIYRSGKELRFEFNNDIVLGMHLMLHGNLYIYEGSNLQKNTIVEFQFENETGLALTDWQGMANIKINPTDKKGIDALAKELTAGYLKEALQTKAIIKNVIVNQDIIRGIGNAYADEILWAAKIHPSSILKSIPDNKVRDLVKATPKVLKDAEQQILKAHPDLITGEVRDFLKIHNLKKSESPTGEKIKVIKMGGRSTYYTDGQELYK
jgi:formamidopyrimidine-DNA glycosylase